MGTTCIYVQSCSSRLSLSPAAWISAFGQSWLCLDTALDFGTSQLDLGAASSPWASMAGTGISTPDPALTKTKTKTSCLNFGLASSPRACLRILDFRLKLRAPFGVQDQAREGLGLLSGSSPSAPGSLCLGSSCSLLWVF